LMDKHEDVKLCDFGFAHTSMSFECCALCIVAAFEESSLCSRARLMDGC
jgi:hypothetical protein